MRLLVHRLHQIICINDRTLTALHLAVGELHHTVGEVDKLLAEGEAELIEQNGEDLEVVLLLITHHVDHAIDGVVSKAHFRRTYVLSHVDRRAIGAKQDLAIQTILTEISPHGAVLVPDKEPLVQSAKYLFLSLKIGVALVVNLIEVDPQTLVGLIKSGVDPVIHLLPERADLLITGLPLLEHLPSFFHKRAGCLGLFLRESLSVHQLLDFGTIVLIEEDIEISHQVVPLLTGALRCNTIAPLEPRQH